MTGFIDNYNFAELDVMKYWQPPSSWSKEKSKAEVESRIFSGEWLGAQKRDGALYVFLKDEDGNITLRGRSKGVGGEYIDKWDHLPHLNDWAEKIPNGTCFLGEVYNSQHEGSNETTKIMGSLAEKAIARQANNKMKYYIFDCLAYAGNNYINTPAAERFDMIHHISKTIYFNQDPNIEYAQYVNGKKLWDLLQQLLADGYEGIVITHKNALYEPGKRPSKTTMKVKKELKQTIDCFFTGKAAAPATEYTGKEIETWQYWRNLVTGERLPEGEHYGEMARGAAIQAVTKPFYYKWAGSLEIAVLKHGEEFSLGWISGLPDEVKANWDKYTHSVVEIGAMQLTEDLRLRHGKILSWREDKKWNECDFSQIVK